MRRFQPAESQVASNRTPRHINSKIVFNLIRRQQSISRAELARFSGLQPSTVSLIVDELIANGWIVAGEAVEAPRGRRPTLLSLNPKRCVIALDLHPSQVTIAVVDIGGQTVSQNQVKLPTQSSAAISTMSRAVHKLIKATPDAVFEGIGICVPGRTDSGSGQLIFAPNMHWPTVGLGARIEKATRLPVVMDNVANACALSELWFGDGDPSRDFLVVNISEGIGTGVFINGRIARGEGGMAGEFGHVQMVDDGALCNCGSHGCWETIASNSAAVRIFRQISGRRGHVDFASVLRLAEEGNEAARTAIAQAARELGRGLRMIATALAPYEIIVVGEITRMWNFVSPVLLEELGRNRIARPVRIRPAPDSATARLRSAAALVLAQHPLAGSLSV